MRDFRVRAKTNKYPKNKFGKDYRGGSPDSPLYKSFFYYIFFPFGSNVLFFEATIAFCNIVLPL